jgi:hypothetical protein
VTGLNRLIGSQPSWLLDLQWQYRCKQTIRNLHRYTKKCSSTQKDHIMIIRVPDKLRFCVIMLIKLTKTKFFYFLCVVEPNSSFNECLLHSFIFM